MLYLIRFLYSVLILGKLPCKHEYGELYPLRTAISQREQHQFVVEYVELERICSKCGCSKLSKRRGVIRHESHKAASDYGDYLISELIRRSPKTLQG